MPKLPVKQFRDGVDNAQILNHIRKNASHDYQRRVPETTKANIKQNVEMVLSNQFLRNEFLDQLINRIGLEIVRGLNWSSPLAKFKRGTLTFGDTIEEIQVGLVKSYVYDADRDELEKAVFGQHRPDVRTARHKISRQEYYPITINQDLLRRAFNSDDGLSSLVSEIMAAPNVSDEYDEFLAMTSLFKVYDDAEGFFKVQVPDISSLTTSNTENARLFAKSVRAYADTLTFPSPHYNASGMHVASPKDRLELFITPEVNASIDVDSLAGAFNVDKANMPTKVNVIPRENFNIPNCQGILTTEDFFVVADSLYETRTQSNPVGLYDNYFLHHHQVISASLFTPAIMLTTGQGSTIVVRETPVTSIGDISLLNKDLAPATKLNRGEYHQILAEGVTTPEGGLNDSVALSLEGNNSPGTYSTNTGTVYVSPTETSNSIKVVVTSVDDDSISKSVEFDVVGDILQPWPNPQVVTPSPIPPVEDGE